MVSPPEARVRVKWTHTSASGRLTMPRGELTGSLGGVTTPGRHRASACARPSRSAAHAPDRASALWYRRPSYR